MSSVTLSGHDPTTGEKVASESPHFRGNLNELVKGDPIPPQPPTADERIAALEAQIVEVLEFFVTKTAALEAQVAALTDQLVLDEKKKLTDDNAPTDSQ